MVAREIIVSASNYQPLVSSLYVLLHISGLILGLPAANDRRRYIVATSIWLGASLESAQ